MERKSYQLNVSWNLLSCIICCWRLKEDLQEVPDCSSCWLKSCYTRAMGSWLCSEVFCLSLVICCHGLFPETYFFHTMSIWYSGLNDHLTQQSIYISCIFRCCIVLAASKTCAWAWIIQPGSAWSRWQGPFKPLVLGFIRSFLSLDMTLVHSTQNRFCCWNSRPVLVHFTWFPYWYFYFYISLCTVN